jgi:drug/metabolite transporter (DMT)-like permease
MSERLKIGIAFFIISTVWGSTWLAIKVGIEVMPPVFSAGVRFVIASAILYVLIRVRRLSMPFDTNAWKLYSSLGLLTFLFPFALVYWGQQFIPTGLSSILFGVFPFWVAIFSHLMLKDGRIDLPKLLSLVIGFTGLVVIFWIDVSLSDPWTLIGMSTIVLSTIMQAYSLILVKRYGQPVSPLVMNFVGMVIGALGLLALSLVFEQGKPVVWSENAILSLLYLSIVGSVLTFVSYYWLLKRVDAVYLSLTSFINPIVAVALGAAVLGERLAPGVFVGAGLVFLGILVANGKALHTKFRPA